MKRFRSITVGLCIVIIISLVAGCTSDSRPSTGRVTFQFVVAASDSSAQSKAQADYVCDGTNDVVQLQAAHDDLPASGGEIRLLEGTFYLEGATFHQVTITKPNVTISGCGVSTVVTWNGDTYLDRNVLSIRATAHGCTIRDILFDVTIFASRVISATGTDLNNLIDNLLIENCHFKADGPKDSGTATGGTGITLVDTAKAWGINEHTGRTVYIYEGTARGNREIISNTADTLTFAAGVAPDTTSKYIIMVQGNEHHYIQARRVSGLTIRGCHFEYSGDEWIDVMGCTNVNIHSNNSLNCGLEAGALVLQESREVNFHDNIIKSLYTGTMEIDIYAYGVIVQSPYDIKVDHNIIETNATGIAISGGTHRLNTITISGNTITSNSGLEGGIQFNSHNKGADEIVDLHIFDNNIEGFATGIYGHDMSGLTNIKIQGNIVRGGSYGIRLRALGANDADHVELLNNTIIDTAETGIEVRKTGAGVFTSFSIKENTIRAMGAGANAGIDLTSGIDGCILRGNTILDCPNNTFGYHIQAGDGLIIENNKITGIATYGWYIRAPVINCHFRDNRSDNNTYGWVITTGALGNVFDRNYASGNIDNWHLSVEVQAGNTFLQNENFNSSER